MKRVLFTAICFGWALTLPATAQDCSNPPKGFGGRWWRQYAEWCSACGGTPNSSNMSCRPGPNWGRQGSSSGSSSSDDSYDSEAERQREQAERRRVEQERERQRVAEEQKRRDEEDARRRQEEFERSKQQALRDMKGIAGELGLKGIDDNELGLKGAGSDGTGLQLKDAVIDAAKTPPPTPKCNWGDGGTSVVDLRCLGLDPGKPILVDPNIARGRPRALPAQIDPATFKNANYNNGFAALMRPTFSVKDAMDAVAYFKAAQLERPDDPLVRNGLLLGQDILKVRQQKERDQKARAAELIELTYAAISKGDMGSARTFIKRARGLDKDNVTIAFVDSILATAAPRMLSPDFNTRFAYEVVGNSLVAVSHQEFKTATVMLQVAHNYAPKDQFISKFYESMEAFTGGLTETSGKTKGK